MNRGTVAGVAADVRFGSLAHIAAAFSNVRFAPESRHHRTSLACPLSARSRHMQCSKDEVANTSLVTSSARPFVANRMSPADGRRGMRQYPNLHEPAMMEICREGYFAGGIGRG